MNPLLYERFGFPGIWITVNRIKIVSEGERGIMLMKYEELSEQATALFKAGEMLAAKKTLLEALKTKVEYVQALDISSKAKDEGFVTWVDEFGLESAVLDSKL